MQLLPFPLFIPRFMVALLLKQTRMIDRSSGKVGGAFLAGDCFTYSLLPGLFVSPPSCFKFQTFSVTAKLETRLISLVGFFCSASRAADYLASDSSPIPSPAWVSRGAPEPFCALLHLPSQICTYEDRWTCSELVPPLK